MDISLLNGKVLRGLPENTTQRDVMNMALQQGLATDAELPSLFPALFDPNKTEKEEKPKLPEEPKENDPSFLQNVYGLGSDLVGGVADLGESLTNLAGVPMPKSLEKYTTDPLAEMFGDAADAIRGTASEEYQAARNEGFIEEGVSNQEALSQFMQGDFSALKAPSWQAVVGTTLSSLPQMPAFVYGGGAALKGLQAVKFFAKNPKLAQFVGYGATNAALVAPTQWRETYSEAIEMGMNEEDAQKSADAAGMMTALISGATGGAGGVIGTSMGMNSGNMASAVAKGFVAEAPFEGLEEMGQSAAGDVGLGRPVDIVKAVESGALGALAGGVPGAGVAAVTQAGNTNPLRKIEGEYQGKLADQRNAQAKLMSALLKSVGGYDAQAESGFEKADPLDVLLLDLKQKGVDEAEVEEYRQLWLDHRKAIEEQDDIAEQDIIYDRRTWDQDYVDQGLLNPEVLEEDQDGYNVLELMVLENEKANMESGRYGMGDPVVDDELKLTNPKAVRRRDVHEIPEERFNLKIKPLTDEIAKIQKQQGLEDIGITVLERMEHVVEDADGNLIYGVRRRKPSDNPDRFYDKNGHFVYADYIQEAGRARGVFDTHLRRIFLSLEEAAADGGSPTDIRQRVMKTLNHEKIHALRSLDLFKPKEWQTLLNATKNRKTENGESYFDWASRLYEGQAAYRIEEEAVAELIAGEGQKIGGKPRNLIDRIGRFFEQMYNAVTGSGFNTFDSVFENIEMGKVGRRKRGVVRDMVVSKELGLGLEAMRKENPLITETEDKLNKLIKEEMQPLPGESAVTIEKLTQADNPVNILNWLVNDQQWDDDTRHQKAKALADDLKGMYQTGAKRMNIDLDKSVWDDHRISGKAQKADPGLVRGALDQGIKMRSDQEAQRAKEQQDKEARLIPENKWWGKAPATGLDLNDPEVKQLASKYQLWDMVNKPEVIGWRSRGGHIAKQMMYSRLLTKQDLRRAIMRAQPTDDTFLGSKEEAVRQEIYKILDQRSPSGKWIDLYDSIRKTQPTEMQYADAEWGDQVREEIRKEQEEAERGMSSEQKASDKWRRAKEYRETREKQKTPEEIIQEAESEVYGGLAEDYEIGESDTEMTHEDYVASVAREAGYLSKQYGVELDPVMVAEYATKFADEMTREIVPPTKAERIATLENLINTLEGLVAEQPGKFEPALEDYRKQYDELVNGPASAEVIRFNPRQQRRGAPVRPDPDKAFESPGEYGRLKKGIWRVQDKLVGLKDIEGKINEAREANGLAPIDFKDSAYRGEEASHGKIGEKAKEFREGDLQAMIDAMANSKVDMAALDRFLVLRHAIERNAQIKKINPNHEGPGAGSLDGNLLTDEYVKDQMAAYDMTWDSDNNRWVGGENNPLNKIAREHVDPMVHGTLSEARDGGLITGATYDHLSNPESGYRYYAPLRGFGTEMLQEVQGGMQGGTGGTGGSMSIMGQQTSRAKGRSSEAFSPLATLVADRERTIARGVKNTEVGQKLHTMILNNPNKEVWEVIGPGHPRYVQGIDPNYTYIGPATDKLIPGKTKKQKIPDGANPEHWTKMVKGTSMESVLDANGEELIGVKINGEQHYIDIKDDRLRQSLLNLEGTSNSKIVNTLGNVNRVLSAVNTTFNPEFVIGNFFRDIQTAIASIKTEQNLDEGVLKELKNENMVKKIASPKALGRAGKTFYKAMTGKLNSLPQQEQADILEFLNAGAKADWFHSKPPEQQHANLQQMLAIANHTFKGNMLQKRNTIKEFVENGNAAVENAVRFSAFREARDAFVKAGLNRDEAVARAASMAKNMTINFNRKGESGNLLNSLYLFFNAQVQGTAVILRGMSSPTKQKIMGSIVATGAMMSMLHEFAEDDEEDGLEKVQDFVRERNMLIPNPMSDTDIKIPLPYGYNFFYQLGSNLYLAARGKMPLQKAGLELAHTFLGSFSPVGAPAGDDIWQSAMRLGTPTAFTPAVEMSVNRNYFGSPIYKEDMQFGTPVPDSHRTWKNSNEVLKALTKGMNELTGGNEHESGMIDVSPDTISYFIGYGLGGMGAFGERAFMKPAGRAVKGKAPFEEWNDVPFMRRFVSEASSKPDMGAYYDHRDQIDQKVDHFEAIRGNERREYLADNREYIAFAPVYKQAEKQLRVLRDRQKMIEAAIERNPDRGFEMAERVERIQDRIDDIINRVNKRFNQKVSKM